MTVTEFSKSGMIVRHLVLPGHLENSYGVIDMFARLFPKGDVLFSLMSQYTPPADKLPYKELNRRVTTLEYNRVYDYMLENGIENGFAQERSSAKEEYTPISICRGFDNGSSPVARYAVITSGLKEEEGKENGERRQFSFENCRSLL